MSKAVKYCIYARYRLSEQWAWVGSYLSLVQAWESKPILSRLESRGQVTPHLVIVKILATLLTPPTLCNATLLAHAVLDPATANYVTPLTRLPVYKAGTPRPPS